MSHLPVAPTPGTHLVVGAGEVGSAVALLLAEAGVDVVIASRRGRGPEHAAIRRVAVDASSVENLLAAVPAAVVIYNCVNPPYHRWTQEWPPMAAAFRAYAERTGAVLATCSNLYVYGPVDVPMSESLPLAATGAKARVRITMWQDDLAVNDAGRIRATEVRGSDYLCSGTQSMFGDRVTPRILGGKSVQLLGDLDQPHSWTSPVDVARTLITVAADSLGWGKPWHVPSNPPRTQREVVSDIAAEAGLPTVKASSVPALVLWGVGLVQPSMRELKETDYQRNRPYVLDDSLTRSTFGLEPTPWSEVLSSVIASYREPLLRQ